MKAKWIISSNHIALYDGVNVSHPSASEIYSFDGEQINSIKCNNPCDDLDIRFSSIGSKPFIKLSNDDKGNIIFSVITKKKGIDVDVDIIDGNIIDHCVYNNTWFFLNETTALIQDIINTASIFQCGRITLKQYIKIIECSLSLDNGVIINLVDEKTFHTPINSISDIPFDLKANLFPYQKNGFCWIKSMLELNNGCILGDEMGLGKTMQVITEMLYLKSISKLPILVVAPISLLVNWLHECAKFAPSLNVHIHHGQSRASNYKELLNYDVIVTSYTTVVSDIYLLNMVTWQLVVLDEAQNIKNPLSARTKACKAINRVCSLAVSGTPFENHITDIWSLIDFVQPNILGSLKTFQSSIPDDCDGGKKIEPILSTLMVRRLVSEVAQDLPEKIVSTQPLLMSENEALMYQKYLDNLKCEYDVNNPNLGMLQNLRIFCTHPFASIDDYDGDPAESSVKYQRFCEIVEEIVSRNEKVIVFTSYKKMFDIFLKDVPQRFGIKAWSINGETPVNERQEIVDRFNNYPSPAALFLNPRAAGTGLNITGANHVIHYNLEWNPSLEDQSSARAYRRGQKKTVFIYRLFYTDTVEEVVNERIERKRDIASNAIVGNNGISQDRADILKALNLIPSICNK